MNVPSMGVKRSTPFGKMDEPHRGTGRTPELGNGGIRSVVSRDMSRHLAGFALQESLLSFAEIHAPR